MNRRVFCWTALTLCIGAQTLLASNLYFSINDDANKYWDHAPGWKEEYRIPTADDNVSFNSMYLDVGARGATPLQITNGVDAVCRVFQIATSGKGSGSSYQDDGRIIGVKMTGGTLTTRNKDDFNWWEEFTVGHNAAGYGRFEMTGGELRPYHGAVGVAGIGVFTNNGGRVVMQGLPGTSCFAVGLQKGAQGRLAMLDGLFTTAVSTNDGCFISVGGSGTGTLDMEGGRHFEHHRFDGHGQRRPRHA